MAPLAIRMPVKDAGSMASRPSATRHRSEFDAKATRAKSVSATVRPMDPNLRGTRGKTCTVHHSPRYVLNRELRRHLFRDFLLHRLLSVRAGHVRDLRVP